MLQRLAVVPLDQQLRSSEIGATRHGCRHHAENLYVCVCLSGAANRKPGLARLVQIVKGIFLMFALHTQQGLVYEWRKTRHPPFNQLRRRPPFKIIIPQGSVQRMIRKGRLNQHLARLVGTPCAPSYLHQLGEESF